MPKKKKEDIERDLKGFETTRKLQVESNLIDETTRKVPFILISQDNEGERYDWWTDEVYIEKLDVNGANYERLNTFFKDHIRSVDSAIGKVENIRIEGGQLKADVIFGADDDAEKIFRKYVEGILTDCSIGYKINATTVEQRKGEPTLVTVTDFEIRELSAVGIGFDKGATVGRDLNLQKGDNSMNEELRKELESLRSAVDGLTAEQKTRLQELEDKEKEAQRVLATSVQAEQTRSSGIMDLVAGGHLSLDRGAEFVKNGTSVDEVRKAILEEKSRQAQTVVVGGIPDAENMMRNIENSILARCGVKVTDAGQNHFRGASLIDMARHLIGSNSLDRVDIAQRAMSNDQFTLLLGNIANRVLVSNFEEQIGTYDVWTRNVDLPNFKIQNDVSMKNPNSRLSKIKEKGELEKLELDEDGAGWKLDSYGNEFSFTRQMIINDDLGAFTNIIAEFGKMVKRTSNGIVYDLLQGKGAFANYKTSDNKPLFHTTHENTSTASPLNFESLDAARVKMRKQKDGEIALNITPKYLIVSPDNETAARQLISSDSVLSSNNSAIVNVFRNAFDVIVDAELEGSAWYLAAASKTIKTGTLAGTGGQPIIQEQKRSAGGITYECLFDFGVKVEDFRGLYKNLGV